MSLGSYEKFSDMHTPRNQREAGIEHLDWVHADPVEPWSRTLFHAVCYGLFFLGCYYIGPILARVVIDWAIGR